MEEQFQEDFNEFFASKNMARVQDKLKYYSLDEDEGVASFFRNKLQTSAGRESSAQ
jgi:hypothetical protein